MRVLVTLLVQVAVDDEGSETYTSPGAAASGTAKQVQEALTDYGLSEDSLVSVFRFDEVKQP